MALLWLVVEFVLGLAVGLAVALAILRVRRGNLRRALVALGYTPLPFALGAALFFSDLGPVKTLGNLGEFILYGAVSGLIPLGQLLWSGSTDREPGEVFLMLLACVVVILLYAGIPTLPETARG